MRASLLSGSKAWCARSSVRLPMETCPSASRQGQVGSLAGWNRAQPAPPRKKTRPKPHPPCRPGSADSPWRCGLTSREKSSGAEAAYRRLKYLEDLALLFLVLWILVLPGWLGSTPEGKVILEEKAVRPARIDVNRAPWYEWMLLE